MNNIISQPSINSIANEYYYDKIKNRIGLDLVDSFALESDFKNAIVDISDMKETDIKIKGHRRLEQGYLRRHLFSRKKIDSCGICNTEYPVEFLSVANTKKCFKCAQDVKLDLNVVIPMCKFGCDEIYERGYIFVEDRNVKIKKESIKLNQISSYCDSINEKHCKYYNNDTLDYFNWHKSFHKIND